MQQFPVKFDSGHRNRFQLAMDTSLGKGGHSLRQR